MARSFRTVMEFDDIEFTVATVVCVDSLRRYLCFTSTLASLRRFLRLAVAVLEGLRGETGQTRIHVVMIIQEGGTGLPFHLKRGLYSL